MNNSTSVLPSPEDPEGNADCPVPVIGELTSTVWRDYAKKG